MKSARMKVSNKRLVYLVLVYLAFILTADGDHEIMCTRFPTYPLASSDLDVVSVGAATYYRKNPYLPIHGSDTSLRYDDGGYHGRDSDPLFVELAALKVRGKWLNGWLKVTAKWTRKPTMPNHPTYSLTIFAEDDYGRILGEFVHSGEMQFAKNCHAVANERADLREQYIPCRGIGPREPLHSWVYHFSKEMNENTGNADVPYFNQTAHSTLQFVTYWRFSQYYCNLVKKFRIMARLVQRDDKGFYQRKSTFFWIFIKTLLASDPIRHLNESTECVVSGSLHLSRKKNLPDWIDSVGITQREIDKLRLPCGQVDDNSKGSYAGRCSLSTEHNWIEVETASPTNPAVKRVNLMEANVDQELQCEPRNVPAGDHFEHYDEYVDNLRKKRLPNGTSATVTEDGCCIIIPPIPKSGLLGAPLEMSDPQPVGRTLFMNSKSSSSGTSKPRKREQKLSPGEMAEEVRIGLNTAFPYAENIWNGRKTHGIFMTMITVFVVPVSYFLSRYYKETFLNTRINFSRVWYFIHGMSVLVMLNFYMGGFYAIRQSKKYAGVSLTSKAANHRSVGWVSLALFLLMGIFGGIRMNAKFPRMVCIGLHGIVGIIFYILNLYLIIGSASIPGSPSASTDEVMVNTAVVRNWNYEVYFITALVWISFEIAFHVGMSIHLYFMDRRARLTVTRVYTPATVATFDEMECNDLPGRPVRVAVLIMYLFFSLVATMILCLLLATEEKGGRGYGPMSCTHTEDQLSLLQHLHDSCKTAHRLFL